MVLGVWALGVGAIKLAGKVLMRTSMPMVAKSAAVPKGPGKNDVGNKEKWAAAQAS